MRGFTLIEVLLSVAVMLILTGMGYLVFLNYARGQSLTKSYTSLLNDLNETKSLSLAQVKPSVGCGTTQKLNGYQVNFDTQSTPQSYAIEVVCSDVNGVEEKTVIKSRTLPDDITVNPEPNPIRFLLSGDLNPSEQYTEGAFIDVANNSGSKYIIVENSGAIYGREFEKAGEVTE